MEKVKVSNELSDDDFELIQDIKEKHYLDEENIDGIFELQKDMLQQTEFVCDQIDDFAHVDRTAIFTFSSNNYDYDQDEKPFKNMPVYAPLSFQKSDYFIRGLHVSDDKIPLLDQFYGNDRSFTKNNIFDSYYITFVFKLRNQGYKPIGGHHKDAYRGNILPDNTQIELVLINLDSIMKSAWKNAMKEIKILYNQLKNSNVVFGVMQFLLTDVYIPLVPLMFWNSNSPVTNNHWYLQMWDESYEDLNIVYHLKEHDC